MPVVIFDARKDAALRATGLFAKPQIAGVILHFDGERRITERAGVLELDKGLVTYAREFARDVLGVA